MGLSDLETNALLKKHNEKQHKMPKLLFDHNSTHSGVNNWINQF